LPSSIHEFIFVPEQFGDIGKITNMVRNINASEVSESEVLSNNIYHYSVEEHALKVVQ